MAQTNCNAKKNPQLKFILPLLASTANQSSSSLTDLVPSTGNLTPSFSPSIQTYNMTVGNSVNSIANGSHCSQWSNTGSRGVVGNGNQTNNNAINLNSPSCSVVQNLLCAEQ